MTQRVIGTALVLLIGQAVVLYLMGQPTMCDCGYVKLWEGVVKSSGNSQHLTDWYTFSHFVHGLVLYAALWFLFPRMALSLRFLIAFALEVGWEVIENTQFLIEHYRQQALAQGYTGDSVINSISDTLAMAVGFFVAWRLPVLLVLVAAIGIEVFVGYSIRDNLILNTLNLIYQFPVIEAWQASG